MLPGVWHGGWSGGLRTQRENPGIGPAREREQVHLGAHCIRSASEAAGFLTRSWCRKGIQIQVQRVSLWMQWGKERAGWTDSSADKYTSFFPGSSVGNESACNAGDPGLIPGLGRSAGEGIGYPLQYCRASLGAQLVKNLPAMQEPWVRSLGWEDLLEKGRSTHSSILAWRIPWAWWTPPWDHRVWHNWATNSVSLVLGYSWQFLSLFIPQTNSPTSPWEERYHSEHSEVPEGKF